jgi:hypothetical protein
MRLVAADADEAAIIIDRRHHATHAPADATESLRFLHPVILFSLSRRTPAAATRSRSKIKALAYSIYLKPWLILYMFSVESRCRSNPFVMVREPDDGGQGWSMG